MNEPKRFAAIFIMAGFTLAAYFYVFTEREHASLKNGTASLAKDETPPRNDNHHATPDSVSVDRSSLSDKKYRSIEQGMTYEAVRAVLQSHGMEVYRDDEWVIFQWTYRNEMLEVTFRDAQVSEKRVVQNPESVHSTK